MENYKLKIFFLKACIKMEKTITKFGNTEIEKHTCHQYKRLISIKNINLIK